MPEQDNQTGFAGQITPSDSTPPSSSGSNDGNIVRLPSGERVELGENRRETK